ncbi:MAG: ABC transporter ATP-binding protein [Lachnospiraceae bacterium]|nr:ABC transporter ATP-binding protein [Lachnospiraceae bacterium]
MTFVFKLFQNRKGTVLLTLLCCVGSVIVTLLWNRELAVLIDGVQAGDGLDRTCVAWCAGCLVIAALFQGAMQFFAGYAGEYAVHDLRMKLARVMMRRDYTDLAKENSAELISVQQNEMEDINRYISDNLFTLCTTVVNFVFNLVFLLTQNAKLTLLYLIPVAGMAVYTTLSGKVIYRYTKREQEQQRKMNGVAGTLLSLFPVVRIYEAEKLLRQNYEERIEGWKDSVVKQERTKAKLMSVSGMLSCIPLVLLMLVGGGMILRGTMTIGVLYVFINLSGNVSGVMINISVHLANFRRFCGNLERVWESMEEEGEREHEHIVAGD